jgi:chitinase
MIGYDDARSYEAKGKFIKDAGLLGFSMWEAAGDYDDILLDSIRSALGFEC